jgi:hypothetical protein
MVKARRASKHMDAGSTHMKAKRQLRMFLIGSMAFIVSLLVASAALCPPDSHGNQFSASTDCTFTSHAFAPIGNGQSALFILFLAGLLLTLNRSKLSPGFYLSPFRPPRFNT